MHFDVFGSHELIKQKTRHIFRKKCVEFNESACISALKSKSYSGCAVGRHQFIFAALRPEHLDHF